jgi:hypothetical protein
MSDVRKGGGFVDDESREWEGDILVCLLGGAGLEVCRWERYHGMKGMKMEGGRGGAERRRKKERRRLLQLHGELCLSLCIIYFTCSILLHGRGMVHLYLLGMRRGCRGE